MNTEQSEKAEILIVDDDPTNLGVLFDYLNASGFRTLIAEDGEGALRKADFARPDIILMDVMMPGIDGFETCRRLKENETTKDIPVIFMTALSDTVDKVRGFKTGAVDYITKPFQQEEVLLRIATHLTIQHQKKELAELNALKDKFFSIISHDMKNIFFHLMGSADLLAMKILDFNYDKVEKDAENIHASLQNAYRLMENLLKWSMLQTETTNFDPRNFDLRNIAMNNILFFMQNAKQKDISLSHTIQTDIPVHANPDMVDTILRNLISNAIKFTQSGGEVLVSARFSKDTTDTDEEWNEQVEVAVTDTGVGISKENIRKLFRIDKKYKKTGTSGERGTGLGLILCKELVEKNNGRIWVESEAGKGTKFWFTLPKGISD
ncbi:hybrid sensor histidine kinase/response regulator [Desulfococcaceae bacterium HSG8]|nr:hybrid sensor histidine kinase/response regulator [Desulfococcaceae bacterium HSG8]